METFEVFRVARHFPFSVQSETGVLGYLLVAVAVMVSDGLFSYSKSHFFSKSKFKCFTHFWRVECDCIHYISAGALIIGTLLSLGTVGPMFCPCVWSSDTRLHVCSGCIGSWPPATENAHSFYQPPSQHLRR